MTSKKWYHIVCPQCKKELKISKWGKPIIKIEKKWGFKTLCSYCETEIIYFSSSLEYQEKRGRVFLKPEGEQLIKEWRKKIEVRRLMKRFFRNPLSFPAVRDWFRKNSILQKKDIEKLDFPRELKEKILIIMASFSDWRLPSPQNKKR